MKDHLAALTRAHRVAGCRGQSLPGHHYLPDSPSRRPVGVHPRRLGYPARAPSCSGAGLSGHRSQSRCDAEALDDVDSGGDRRSGGPHGCNVPGCPCHGEHLLLRRDLPQRHVAGVHRLPAVAACSCRLCRVPRRLGHGLVCQIQAPSLSISTTDPFRPLCTTCDPPREPASNVTGPRSSTALAPR